MISPKLSIKHSFGLMVVLVLVALIAFAFFSKSHRPSLEGAQTENSLSATDHLANREDAPTTQLQDHRYQSLDANSVSTPASGHSTNINQGDKLQNQLNASVEAMNAPIAFRGQVLDQYSNAVPQAKVSLSYRTWRAKKLDADADQTNLEAVTDDHGLFQIRDAYGDRLSIVNVEKPDYVISPKAKKSFPFANSPKIFTPDPNALEVIRMWKLKAPEQTVSQKGFFRIELDGQSHSIDLLANTITTRPTDKTDLEVRIIRPSEIKPGEKYPWVLDLTVPEGGLLEATDEFLFEAPENGFESTVKIEMNPEAPEWTSVLKKSFYIKSRGGKTYAAVQLTIRPVYQEGSAIQTESVINPSGSRNLQH